MALDLLAPAAAEVWQTPEPGGMIRLGLADGVPAEDTYITGIRFAQTGAQLVAGDVLCTLELKTKVCEGNSCTYQSSELKLRAPKPIVIAEVNRLLEADPLLLQIDPRGTGWIAMARVNEHTT